MLNSYECTVVEMIDAGIRLHPKDEDFIYWYLDLYENLLYGELIDRLYSSDTPMGTVLRGENDLTYPDRNNAFIDLINTAWEATLGNNAILGPDTPELMTSTQRSIISRCMVRLYPSELYWLESAGSFIDPSFSRVRLRVRKNRLVLVLSRIAPGGWWTQKANIKIELEGWGEFQDIAFPNGSELLVKVYDYNKRKFTTNTDGSILSLNVKDDNRTLELSSKFGPAVPLSKILEFVERDLTHAVTVVNDGLPADKYDAHVLNYEYSLKHAIKRSKEELITDGISIHNGFRQTLLCVRPLESTV